MLPSTLEWVDDGMNEPTAMTPVTLADLPDATPRDLMDVTFGLDSRQLPLVRRLATGFHNTEAEEAAQHAFFHGGRILAREDVSAGDFQKGARFIKGVLLSFDFGHTVKIAAAAHVLTMIAAPPYFTDACTVPAALKAPTAQDRKNRKKKHKKRGGNR